MKLLIVSPRFRFHLGSPGASDGRRISSSSNDITAKGSIGRASSSREEAVEVVRTPWLTLALSPDAILSCVFEDFLIRRVPKIVSYSTIYMGSGEACRREIRMGLLPWLGIPAMPKEDTNDPTPPVSPVISPTWTE
ncbi:unnamed protein product [Cyprideis torosa]|uniref:Uncharacterized protein n=1 Tax=Cyprideis torosa TaxID=163714 RepID=A0A7R8W7N8_9CRUS|nr:unnamed protein product [Cyprideis torosa]CAG0885387.1 unnamed protein product [Cyprideis torosa]